MRRTGVRRRRLAVGVGVAIVGAVWAGPVAAAAGGQDPVRPVAARTYVVRAGDTLWGIAGRVAGGRDPRGVIDAIARANGVDPGALVPGQTLVIPAGV